MSDIQPGSFLPGQYVLDPVALGLPQKQSFGPGVWLGHWDGSAWTRNSAGSIILRSNYATVWDRFGYSLFDWLVITVIGFAATFGLSFLGFTRSDGSSLTQFVFVQQPPDSDIVSPWSASAFSAGLFLAFVWFGYLMLCYLLMGRSLGQRIAGVRLVGLDGKQLSRAVLFTRAAGLAICLFLSPLYWVLALSTVMLTNNVTFLDKMLNVWAVNKVIPFAYTPPLDR